MQTTFTAEQLENPLVAEAERILRKCVHCGFCTATCPTFALLGDELDSPRGRIYLIKDMLEADKPATEKVAKHIDRCLTCLSCTTTCPSGVDYMHLVDSARAHIEKTWRRPLADRLMRRLLAAVLPYPGRLRLALALSFFARPLAQVLRHVPGMTSLAAMLALAPTRLAGRSAIRPGSVHKPAVMPRARVAIMSGCAQSVLAPSINEAAIRLMRRAGVEIVVPEGEGCCGALVHHMGREEEARISARRNIDAWMREIEGEGIDAILITASGCGTTVKDYGHLFKDDRAYAEKARKVAALARDITEYALELDLGTPSSPRGLAVAYHSACSLQHGQKVTAAPKDLLTRAGYAVKDVPEGHLCCGSAGVYNILQPEIATRLRDRKLANIARTTPDIIAAGNLGCITQIGSGTDIPIVHTVELLDWAHGGPAPEALSGHALAASA